jgi:hypothetical protein
MTHTFWLVQWSCRLGFGINNVGSKRQNPRHLLHILTFHFKVAKRNKTIGGCLNFFRRILARVTNNLAPPPCLPSWFCGQLCNLFAIVINASSSTLGSRRSLPPLPPLQELTVSCIISVLITPISCRLSVMIRVLAFLVRRTTFKERYYSS